MDVIIRQWKNYKAYRGFLLADALMSLFAFSLLFFVLYPSLLFLYRKGQERKEQIVASFLLVTVQKKHRLSQKKYPQKMTITYQKKKYDVQLTKKETTISYKGEQLLTIEEN